MAKILLVDDDDQMRKYLSILLNDAGHSVSEATDGKKAIQTIQEASFDLMITDVSMPEMDGIELIREVRKRISSIKIMAISGAYWDAPDLYLNLAKHFGTDAVLCKPLDPDRFIEKVIYVLGTEYRTSAINQSRSESLHSKM